MQTASTFNPAAPVSCRYGAPLGRGNIGNDFDVMQPRVIASTRSTKFQTT